MKLAEGVVTSRAIAVLISAATRLELIDHWETRSSKVIFVKGPVCYHVGMDNAAAFLESLINLHEVEQMGVKPIK